LSCKRRLEYGGDTVMRQKDAAADAWTLAAVGVIAYFSASQGHEFAGHGSACVAIGGHLARLTAEYASCDGTLSRAGLALLHVSGALANLALGLLCFLVLPRLRRGWPRFCAWFVGTVNLLTAAGYLMVSAWTGMGDWGELFGSLPGDPIVRITAGALGLVASLALSRLAAARLSRVGAPPPHRRLLLIPYLAGCAVAITAGALDPRGLVFAGVAAGSSMAATCWIVLDVSRREALRPPDDAPASPMPMRPTLVATGVVLTAAFLIVGHGLAFGR
jgi:hypothetical protein